jgi:hypothetical protein
MIYSGAGTDTAVVEVGDLIDGTTAVTPDSVGELGGCEAIRLVLFR